MLNNRKGINKMRIPLTLQFCIIVTLENRKDVILDFRVECIDLIRHLKRSVIDDQKIKVAPLGHWVG